MSKSKAPYSVLAQVSIKDVGATRERLTQHEGCESMFVHTGALYAKDTQSYQVYKHSDGRFFVIHQEFSKKRGQLFDCFLCEVKIHPEYKAI